MRVLLTLGLLCALPVGGALHADTSRKGAVTFDPKRPPVPPGKVFDTRIDPRKLKLPASVTGSLLFYDFKNTPVGPYVPAPVQGSPTTQSIEASYVEMVVVPAGGPLPTRSLRITPGANAYYVGPYFTTIPVDLSGRKVITTEWTGDLPPKKRVEFHLFTGHFETLSGVVAENGVLSAYDGNQLKTIGAYAPGAPTGTGYDAPSPETFRFETDLLAKTYTVTMKQDGKVVNSGPLAMPSGVTAGYQYVYFWVAFADGSKEPSYKLAKVAINASFK